MKYQCLAKISETYNEPEGAFCQFLLDGQARSDAWNAGILFDLFPAFPVSCLSFQPVAINKLL
jgi:hypothetical protein